MLAMNVKYNILRYMVSFFHGIKATGGAYYKPLFFNYPNDLFAYQNIEQNTMLGESVKFSFNPSMNF
jgi:alpha-glucosidase (family GH31 glycosyl hydrolase)